MVFIVLYYNFIYYNITRAMDLSMSSEFSSPDHVLLVAFFLSLLSVGRGVQA